jgi:hypothetical protein
VSYQPSEIATLILFLAFGPVIIVALRRTLHPVPSSCYIALGAMFGAYVFTVAEGFIFPELLNLLEHACYAVAGVTFALMLLEFRRVSPHSRHPR